MGPRFRGDDNNQHRATYPMASAPNRHFLAGVMGWPIHQSRSPMLHNYWFKQHNIAGTYIPLAVKPEDIHIALRALPAWKAWFGIEPKVTPELRAMIEATL